MVERCDESSQLDVSLAENETQEIKHERRLKMERREDHVNAVELEVSSNTAQKSTEEEQQSKMTEECMFGGSCPNKDDNMERNTDHQQLPLHLMSNSAAGEETPAVKPAADELQNVSLSCLTEAEPHTTDCRKHPDMDDLGTAALEGNNMDLLPLSTQKENQRGDAMQPGESVQSQQLMLHPPNHQTDTERQERGDIIISSQAPGTEETEEQKTLYHSVLHHLQQQQRHKPGRRFKKKTLMKTAKLNVIFEGRESKMMEEKYSHGSSAEHEPSVLNQKDLFTSGSLVTSRSDTVNANSLTDGKSDCDKETVLSDFCSDATFSGQTAATVTLTKRKTSSTRRKQEKEESKLSGAAETDFSASTNVLDKNYMATESLLNSRPVTASKEKKKLREMSSVAPREEIKITCENSELLRKKPKKRRRKKSAKASKVGVKKRNEQNPQTFTEYNDVVTQDVSEGVLASCDEPPLANSSLTPDTVCNGMDLNAVKQEHNKSETSELTPEAPSLFQDEVSPVESVPSAAPARKSKAKRKRRRRKKTGWGGRKKPKPPQISAHCSNPADVEMSTFSFQSSPCNSVSDDEKITLKLKDENNDVKQRNTDQTLTTNTKVKHSSKLKDNDLRRHELKPQKPLGCSFCGHSLQHVTAFTVHRRIHTGEKPYRCPTCGKRFSQLSKLSVHLKTHREPRAVCCPCCAETFKSKDELILHFHTHVKNTQSSKMTEHTAEDTNNQHVCDRLDSSGASSHNKPLRCSVCFKEFLNRDTFKMHRRTRGGKPHSCSVCRKRFSKSSSLSFHEKTHWPVKPYSCSVCWKGFIKLQELKHHSQTHSGAISFSFDKGEKAFSSFEELHSHQDFEDCFEGRDAAQGNQSDMDGFLVSQSVVGQIVTPLYFKCVLCKNLHHYWCQYVLHLQTHTQSNSYTCETCRQQYDQTAEVRRHCIVCCRKSGEERACRSSLTDIWKEPEAPEDQVLKPHLDLQNVPPDEGLTGKMSALPEGETGEKGVKVMRSHPPSLSVSSLSVNDDFDTSAPPTLSSGICPASDQASRQPSRFRLQALFRRHCGRYSCAHCGKSFSRWSKLWLHRRLHRQTDGSFSCSQCDLEFLFLGSYIDHLREHAAQTPHACPVCPDAFASEVTLSAHMSECHKQCDFMKCSTCGKNFSNLKNLKKHKLLHKGSSSHFCLLCKVSFSSNRALKTHLKTHMSRVKVPQPAGPVEPLSFPYHCRKCTAKFSSTDLLQAHQICHFTGGKKAESVVSCIPRRAAEDAQGVVTEASQRKRCLPVSNKKHLFRYPHPDRLYVVPVVSLEPPIVISDTEEERQEIQIQSPSISTSASNALSDFPQTQPAASFNPQSISDIPQPSVSNLRDMNEHRTISSDLRSCKDIHDISGSESDSAEPLLFIPKEKEFVDDVHSCAICMETFADISKLHQHYIEHARGE